jgi:hypothetical protein
MGDAVRLKPAPVQALGKGAEAPRRVLGQAFTGKAGV